MAKPIEFDLLSAKEVAEIIGVNAASVLYYARTTSTFPQPIRFNRKIVRWRKADLLSYLNGNAPTQAASGASAVSCVVGGGD